MTVEEFIRYATSYLAANNIGSARLDSLILTEYVLKTDRVKLLVDKDKLISNNQLKVLKKLLNQRAKHIPISYITQVKEFYGRNFFINYDVLEPRPESEAIIDELKYIYSEVSSLKSATVIRAADVGTGSGAIGITAMLELPNLQVDLIDISNEALKVAKKNVVIHAINTNILHSDLLSNNHTDYQILMCNLPYIPDDFHINLAASHEPKSAIFGGKNGLEIYLKLFKLMHLRQRKPLYILCESLPTQHPQLELIAKRSGYRLLKTNDFVQLFTVNK